MRVTVRAPATVANLGPGFDALAMALDMWCEFVVDDEAEPGIFAEGEEAEALPRDASNLAFRAITYLARESGRALPPVRLVCRGVIPLERGLGSSAAAVVGGLVAADRLLGTALPPDRLLELAADLEGHADNAAACLRGGIALAWLSDRGWRAERLEPSPELRPLLLVPSAERVATDEARRVLPRSVPHAVAAFTAGRAALLVLALTRRPNLLGAALEDRLHQPYRLPLAPAARALFEDLREAGIPVCVAGSGPALLAFEGPGVAVWPLGEGWTVLRPAPATAGATARVD